MRTSERCEKECTDLRFLFLMRPSQHIIDATMVQIREGGNVGCFCEVFQDISETKSMGFYHLDFVAPLRFIIR